MRLRFGKQLSATALAAIVFAVGCSGDDGDNGNNGNNGGAGENGANGATSLISLTPIEPGDATCPGGGTLVQSGLDNGDGGGTAADGVLQAGEVDNTQSLCQGTTSVGSLTPPPGAAGTYFMNAKGGNASDATGTGGQGGYFYGYFDYGSNGGHLKLFKTGQVDASFTAPAAPATSNYGVTALTVTATTHVKRVNALTDATDSSAAALAAGDIVFQAGCGSGSLYRWNSTSSADAITGVHVQAGATLTFDHYDSCPNYSVILPMAVRLEGTLTAGRAASGTSDSVRLYVGSYYSAPGSSVVLTGANASTGSNGGNGGYFQIEADRIGGYVGSVWSYGTIDNSGGSGDSGGSGGGMYIWGDNQTVITGNITSKGGNATTAGGTAGDGGSSDLESAYGNFWNSAIIDTTGGSGGTQGGSGGYLYFYADYYGDVRNTGEVRTFGGAPAAGCAAACRGGSGGDFYVFAYGDISNSASISTYGAEGLTGNGGSGGYVYFYSESDDDGLVSDEYTIKRGTIAVSGNLDLHGGNGALQGGNARYVYAEAYLYYNPHGQEISFYGYGGGFDGRGGDGGAQGGSAQYAYLYQTYGYNGDHEVPGGSIVNYVDFDLRGGNSSAGVGGTGGYLEATTENYRYGAVGLQQVINHGNINTSGGNGVTRGGSSNYIAMWGLDAVTNGGNLTANAGSSSGAAATTSSCNTYDNGNEGPHAIVIASDDDVLTNTGALTSNGGAATGTGSDGSSSCGILVAGYTTSNSGALVANGGNGTTNGGNGGSVTVRSNAGASVSTGALQANGGTGATAGSAGIISVDGQLL